MTVLSLNVNVTYTGTGSVGPFSFNFPISTPQALTVIQNNAVLPETSYTIAPVNNDYDNGGQVTLNAPCPVGQTLVLQRITPLTQTSVFTQNLPQLMQQFEDAADKLTEIVQEIVANESGGGGQQTFVVAGTGIVVTGTGAVSNPYVVSLAAGLDITSFTGGQAGELGQPFVNPAFNVTYNGTPTSANIANTDNINSPFALSSSYTTASITGTFSHSAPATTIFTLTASNGVSSPTATQQITWAERIFSGLGSAGATYAGASGNNAVLNTGDTLTSAGLGVEQIGQTFGPFNPAGQNVYLLLAGGSHTFIDVISGFPFAFNAPLMLTFVNQYGVSLTMYLYQSTNSLTGTFEPKVVS